MIDINNNLPTPCYGCHKFNAIFENWLKLSTVLSEKGFRNWNIFKTASFYTQCVMKIPSADLSSLSPGPVRPPATAWPGWGEQAH